MHPVHDVDVLLLFALALSAKKRPAELVEIMAAVDLLHGVIPAEQKLREAFFRLGAHGLIQTREAGFALTPAAQEMVAEQPKKGDEAERIQGLREALAACPSDGKQAPVELSAEQISAAIVAYRHAAKGSGKNMLVPKPRPAEGEKSRPGQRQRKPLPSRRRG